MNRSAFRFLELPVVVSILPLLLPILTPSLAQTRKFTKVTVCQRNLRQLQVAYTAYAAGWRTRLLPYICDGARPDAFWMQTLQSYYAQSGQIRRCPGVPGKNPESYWGTASWGWGGSGGWMNGHYGSFGIRGWLYDIMSERPDGKYNYPSQDRYDWECTGRTFSPGVAAVWFDCNWVDAWPWHTQDPSPDLVEGSRPGESSMGRVCIVRHDWSINVAFADGTAHNVPLPELWLLLWNPSFVPTVRTVP